MRQMRVIELPAPPQDPGGGFYKRTEKTYPNGTYVEERTATTTELIISEWTEQANKNVHGVTKFVSTSTLTLPRHIDFTWIVQQASTEQDDDYEDFRNDDGWAHNLEILSDFPGPVDHFKQIRGYIGYYRGRYEDYTCVTISTGSFGGESRAAMIQHLRLRGASKQVAQEVAAARIRAYLDQLASWYQNGQDHYFVKISITLGGKEYEESCGGYDNEDYATTEGAAELAGQIAYAIEQDGFIVTGYDRWVSYQQDRLENEKRRLAYNLNMFNWTD